MHRRLTRIFENETAFAVGVTCLALLPIAMMAAAIFMTAIPFFVHGGALWWVGILIVAAALALLVAGTLSLVVRRLHDLGFSGYHAIWVGAAEFAWAPLTYAPPKVMLASLPLAAICAWVAFWPGSKGLNRFGE